MAKKILAIFFVSILLCSYIIPTTSASADVVIGDNDSYAVTELGVQNGKRIATMEAILQLLESGVSEINFNDITDLDDYIDDFYDELTNVNYQDVSNELLAGAYNDVKELKQWIDDRGEYIATYYKDYLNSADEGLSDIFNDFQLKLPKSKLVGTSLNGFRGMSRFNPDNPTPNPNPDFSSICSYLSGYIKGVHAQGEWIDFGSCYFRYNLGSGNYVLNPSYPFSIIWDLGNIVQFTSVGTVYLTKNSDDSYNATYVFPIKNCFYNTNNVPSNYTRNITWLDEIGNQWTGARFDTLSTTDRQVSSVAQTNFVGLSTAMNYLYNHFTHINLYVDGELWASAYDNTSGIDIDGFIKLYGNDNPIQYEFPEGTQIDYNALYTTIYNAIRDNLPLDMQTINNNQVYYDSHDTVYSPTIYNYYGKDGDDENDWIDSILDYATIPDFNSVLGTVAVLDAPFVNGITIVNAGVTDVIPTDILLILGGFFVLVLFVCIINRMSE